MKAFKDYSRSMKENLSFDYPIRVQPHHTDYAGIVWHGTYIRWLEEARVEYLRSMGVEFADLVASGCDLPVVELSLRYRKALYLGCSAIVKAKINLQGVRLNWDYEIRSPDDLELYLTARVVLVPVDRQTWKIMRQLPPILHSVLNEP
ncbi:MAG: thioesterase family protein [Cyanobacteria bacterium P01_E01_bin.42]